MTSRFTLLHSLLIMSVGTGVLVPQTVAASKSEKGATELLISPRFEAYVASTHAFVEAVQESRSSKILAPLFSRWAADEQDASEFLSQTVELLSQFADWPDTSLQLATYAPNREGKPRWRATSSWPLQECIKRLGALIDDERYDEYFEGVQIESSTDGFEVRLMDQSLAYLYTQDDLTIITSHADIPAPITAYRGEQELDSRPVLMSCRRELAQTETDSGETFFSQFRFLTEFEYTLALSKEGDWVEQLSTSWPPISGTVAKAILGRVRQSFFIPQESLLGAAFEVTIMPATLDAMVGLGPQATYTASGEMEYVGQNEPGILALYANPEMSLNLLEGNGFFPAPDIVLQSRLSDPNLWHSAMGASVERLNRDFVKRDQPQPWHVEDVDGIKVYWRDSSPMLAGASVPFFYRSVLFVSQERDARERDRDFLIIGFTSTDPLKLVKRWKELPRDADKTLYLPKSRRTNGQVWLNWHAIYRTVSPYMNLALSGASTGRLLQPIEDVADQLSPGLATMSVSYKGAALDHTGPAPFGVLAVPALFFSAQDTGSLNSDLARERVAIERLQLLYHHSKLFRKDIGRWPARVAELDGYVDFAGHPELLKLPRSSAQSWEEGFTGFFSIFGDEEDSDLLDEPIDEGLGATGRINDKLYDISWGREAWALGYAEDTLDHLEKLWIDQDGHIHRTLKQPESENKTEGESQESEMEAEPRDTSVEPSTNPSSEPPTTDAAVVSETE